MKHFLLFILLLWSITTLAQNQENYTYSLTQSTADTKLWTTLPTERVFKTMNLPSATGSDVKLYMAKNEFEPIQIIVKPTVAKNFTLTISGMPAGVSCEMFRVKFVNITQASDALGQTGYYPDPLSPIETSTTNALPANENTSFWLNFRTLSTVTAGDYTISVNIGGIIIPVKLHVFNFPIPKELHVSSQMNYSDQTILTKYGVSGTGANYWTYVDKIKQIFIDHRLTPRSPLWSGGLTSSGGAPYINYDCNTKTLSDPHQEWGFLMPAERYLKGTGLMNGNFTQAFNEGTGFPCFQAATFQNNDAGADQRPSSFCGTNKAASDWYTGNNPNSTYNKAWFSYITAMQNYLKSNNLINKAYYYFANEPQDQTDYNAVAWYARELKKAAPELKLMVSEEARSEIYNNASFPGAKIDIWLPVLQNFNPTISNQRFTNNNEESWIYFLRSTRPPYFNPITLDHSGIESKYTGWFLWKYRIRGWAYYALNDWSNNPWTTPMADGHNGELFMFYPPKEDNSNLTYGANNHRFVPSVRFELMRDGLEDYEYFYLLNNSQQPTPNVSNTADKQVDKIIAGLTSYTRDANFMYNLRRLIGKKIAGEITSIPDITPELPHARAAGQPAKFYINFQDPAGKPLTTKTVSGQKYYTFNSKDYMQIGSAAYNSTNGYGWYAPNDVNWIMNYDQYFDNGNELQKSQLYSDWGRKATFEFVLPNGAYNISVSIGHRGTHSKQYVTVEGVKFFEAASTSNSCQVKTLPVNINDYKLTMEIGAPTNNEYTMLNYIEIVPAVTTSIDEIENPYKFIIKQNSTSAIFEFNVENTTKVDISIFDITGRKLETVTNKTYTSGKYNEAWNTSNLTKGLYLCCLSVNGKAVKTLKYVVK